MPVQSELAKFSRNNSGTLRIGIHGAASALGLVDFGSGIAISFNEIGWYNSRALGIGPAEDVNVSIVFNWSNASSIKDLGGSGRAASIGGGALGHLSLQGELSDTVPGQQQIISGGFGMGLGAGAGASGALTETEVSVWGTYEN